jgi:hypothetical protein
MGCEDSNLSCSGCRHLHTFHIRFQRLPARREHVHFLRYLVDTVQNALLQLLQWVYAVCKSMLSEVYFMLNISEWCFVMCESPRAARQA